MNNGKYGKEITDEICKLFEADSYTVVEVCDIVGITEKTYYEWINTHSEFCESIKRSKEKYKDGMLKECEKSLKKLVVGYEYEEITKEMRVLQGSETPTQYVKKVKKHVAPNLGAIIHYQTNKDPENWKNRQSTESNVKIETGLELDPKKAAEFIKGLKDE